VGKIRRKRGATILFEKDRKKNRDGIQQEAANRGREVKSFYSLEIPTKKPCTYLGGQGHLTQGQQERDNINMLQR